MAISSNPQSPHDEARWAKPSKAGGSIFRVRDCSIRSKGRSWPWNRRELAIVGLDKEDTLAGLRLAEVGFVFQFHFLLPEFSALENVMLPMQRLGRLQQLEIGACATELLDRLGLAGERGKLPRQLSGGQSQRVAIARALANDPLLILADEPTGNLDSAASANVQRILKDLARDYGRAVVVVTHDRDFAAAADRVIVMSDGKIRSSA